MIILILLAWSGEIKLIAKFRKHSSSQNIRKVFIRRVLCTYTARPISCPRRRVFPLHSPQCTDRFLHRSPWSCPESERLRPWVSCRHSGDGEREDGKGAGFLIKMVSSPQSLPASLTFFDQVTAGTGLPDALHSIDTDPPVFTVNWPLDGTIRSVGGTEKKKQRTKRGRDY